MASEIKLREKIENLGRKLREKGGMARAAEKEPARLTPAIPLVGALSAYVGGYTDGMVGTPTNQNPATLTLGVLGLLGTLGAAWGGHTKLGMASAGVSASNFGALSHAAGIQKGQASRRPAAG
jgi:hypothetical protein